MKRPAIQFNDLWLRKTSKFKDVRTTGGEKDEKQKKNETIFYETTIDS